MNQEHDQPSPLTVIARIKTPLPAKFGVPRQSGLVDSLRGVIIFEEPYKNADALRSLEEFSHLWLIWGFSETVNSGWSPLVRPPRCGGNDRVGVFASRSPFRPNNLGLSVVRLDRLEFDPEQGPLIHVSGIDMIDNSPIYDLKPYLSYTDCHPEATGGYTEQLPENRLTVNITAELLNLIPAKDHQALIGILSHDPRPAYQQDSDRVYGLRFADLDIRFTVKGAALTVSEIIFLPNK